MGGGPQSTYTPCFVSLSSVTALDQQSSIASGTQVAKCLVLTNTAYEGIRQLQMPINIFVPFEAVFLKSTMHDSTLWLFRTCMAAEFVTCILCCSGGTARHALKRQCILKCTSLTCQLRGYTISSCVQQLQKSLFLLSAGQRLCCD